MKKNIIIILALSFLLCGCSEQLSSSETSETQETITISVGEYDTSAPVTYSDIYAVEGYTFKVRDRDLSGEFDINPLSVLNTQMSPRFINTEDYKYNSISLTDIPIIFNTDNEYLLYKPSECIYSLRKNTSFGCSLLFYTQETANKQIENYLGQYGLSSVECIPETVLTSASPDKGDFTYYEKVQFVMSGIECSGFIYIVESDEGQTFFFIGANDNHISTEEIDFIASSFSKSDNPKELIDDNGVTDISYDYHGLLLTGEFSDKVGLLPQIDSSYLFSYTESIGENELYFANPYTNIVVKYNVYDLSSGITPDIFLAAYPGGFNTLYTETTDLTDNVWSVYDKDYDDCYESGYMHSSLIICFCDSSSVVFQLWYDDEDVKDCFIAGLSSVEISIGNSYPVRFPEKFQEKVNELVPVQVSTPTDAILDLD